MWWKNFFIMGFFLIPILIAFFLIDISIHFHNNKYFKVFKKNESSIEDEIEIYSNKSLKFLTLNFASLTFMIGTLRSELQEIEGPLTVLVLSLCLFIISYRIEIISKNKRLWLLLKKRFFNYALLSLIIGITWLFNKLSPNIFIFIISIASSIIFIFLHVFDNKRNIKIAKERKRGN